MISVNAPSCRFCHVPVDVKVAEQLWAEKEQLWVKNLYLATAITRAKTYSVLTTTAMVITALVLMTMDTFANVGETWVVCQLLAISYGAQWLSHNGSLRTDDQGYLEAVTKVKKATLCWTVLLLLQAIAYLSLNGVPDWNTIQMLE